MKADQPRPVATSFPPGTLLQPTWAFFFRTNEVIGEGILLLVISSNISFTYVLVLGSSHQRVKKVWTAGLLEDVVREDA